MTKISSLTEEQRNMIPDHVSFWTNVGLSCEPIVFEAAIEAVILAINCTNQIKENTIAIPDKWEYARSPKEAFQKAKVIDPLININLFLNKTLWGCYDADWISFYDYMQNVVKVKNIDCIEGLRQMALNCGWVTIIKDTCIIQDRPMYIKFDEQRRSHCENGPAIEYRDGYSVMIWHGTRVPREWILNGITAEEALRVENSEQRRAACEIVGWQNILEQLNYVVIDRDEDPMIGTLVEVKLPVSNRSVSDEKFLIVKCGTGRQFALPVPPDMKTALQANAWTYGLEAYEYNPEVRT